MWSWPEISIPYEHIDQIINWENIHEYIDFLKQSIHKSHSQYMW